MRMNPVGCPQPHYKWNRADNKPALLEREAVPENAVL